MAHPAPGDLDRDDVHATLTLIINVLGRIKRSYRARGSRKDTRRIDATEFGARNSRCADGSRISAGRRN